MKISSCYNCSSKHYTFYAEENGFFLVKCDVCGLLFVENPPNDDEISEAHKQGKHVGIIEFDVTGKFAPDKISKYLKVLKGLFNKENLDSKKTWLDIGCGYGEFIIAVQKYFPGEIDVKGSEPNVHKQESAQKRGLNVGYFDIGSHEEKYDVVSLLNVYSHLPDPKIFLESVKRLLKPNGELILETGDTADLSANDHYRPFYLPDHLSFASERIIIGILDRVGFDILNINKYPSVFMNSFLKELIKIFLPRYKSKIRYYFKKELYSSTDMFIRAKIRN